MSRYIKETITNKKVNPAGGFIEEQVEIDVPLYANKINKFKGLWDVCSICHNVIPQTEMGYINGQPLCYEFDCYQSRVYELTRGDL